MPNDNVPAFRPLTGLYEPSAIQQLPAGRFIVVEDEKSHPLSLVTIGADGSVAVASRVIMYPFVAGRCSERER